jgi:spore germination protein YaaH
MNKTLKIYLVVILLLLCVSSCKEALKLNSSVRRTQSQVKSLKNSLKSLKIPFDQENNDSENSEIDSTIYLTIEQKNMLNDYGYIYDVLNKNDNGVRSDNFKWDSINEVYYVSGKNYKAIKPNNEVFGWHPYWMGSKWENYPFDLLSTISYFSYKVDPLTGGFTNPNQITEWENTKMIDSAKLNNTRVLLTVSCHGSKNNAEFLDNEDRWDVLIKTVSDLLLKRDADGVDLNFEIIPYFKREKFNDFVRYFRKNMDDIYSNANKPFFLSITLPAENRREGFEVEELQNSADLLIIMGYDYHVGNQTQGAVAPLKSIENQSLSLTNTLEQYQSQGIDVSKTILALPYYGSLWNGDLEQDGDEVYNVSTFEKALTYGEIKKNYIDNKALNIVAFRDENSMTNYFNLIFKDNSTKELWFDDDYTLRKKFDFALSNKLKGVGIWALGYDNGYDDLWNVIEDKFSTDQQIIKNPIAETEGYPVQFSKFLLQYKSLFITAAFFFLMTVVLAFLFLLSDWKVRDSIVRNKLHLLIFTLAAFVLLIPLTIVIFQLLNEVLPWFNVYLISEWRYYISFLIGQLTLFLAYRIRIKPVVRP